MVLIETFIVLALVLIVIALSSLCAPLPHDSFSCDRLFRAHVKTDVVFDLTLDDDTSGGGSLIHFTL